MNNWKYAFWTAAVVLLFGSIAAVEEIERLQGELQQIQTPIIDCSQANAHPQGSNELDKLQAETGR